MLDLLLGDGVVKVGNVRIREERYVGGMRTAGVVVWSGLPELSATLSIGQWD